MGFPLGFVAAVVAVRGFLVCFVLKRKGSLRLCGCLKGDGWGAPLRSLLVRAPNLSDLDLSHTGQGWTSLVLIPPQGGWAGAGGWRALVGMQAVMEKMCQGLLSKESNSLRGSNSRSFAGLADIQPCCSEALLDDWSGSVGNALPPRAH